MYIHVYTHMYIQYVYTYVYTYVFTYVYTYVYTRKQGNKRELLKTSNETQTPQKKERKKLSPEARKQTRASESLK